MSNCIDFWTGYQKLAILSYFDICCHGWTNDILHMYTHRIFIMPFANCIIYFQNGRKVGHFVAKNGFHGNRCQNMTKWQVFDTQSKNHCNYSNIIASREDNRNLVWSTLTHLRSIFFGFLTGIVKCILLYCIDVTTLYPR